MIIHYLIYQLWCEDTTLFLIACTIVGRNYATFTQETTQMLRNFGRGICFGLCGLCGEERKSLLSYAKCSTLHFGGLFVGLTKIYHYGDKKLSKAPNVSLPISKFQFGQRKTPVWTNPNESKLSADDIVAYCLAQQPTKPSKYAYAYSFQTL